MGLVSDTEGMSMQNWPVLMKMREVKMYVMVHLGDIPDGSIDPIISTAALPKFFFWIVLSRLKVDRIIKATRISL